MTPRVAVALLVAALYVGLLTALAVVVGRWLAGAT